MSKLKVDGIPLNINNNSGGNNIDMSNYVTVELFNDKFNQVNDDVLYLMDEMTKKADSEEMVKLIDLKANNDVLIKAQEYLQSQITYNYNVMIENDDKHTKDIEKLNESFENIGQALGTMIQSNIDSMKIELQNEIDSTKVIVEGLEKRVNDALENLKE